MLREMMATIGIAATITQSQGDLRVVIRDDTGAPVAHALVMQIDGGPGVVANDSGLVILRARSADSLQLRVRRIGYREFVGWVKRDASGRFEVAISRTTTTLAGVNVSATSDVKSAPLTQRGFYDRLDRVQKGAILGDLYTPEQLEERASFSKITQMIAGSRYARVQSMLLDPRIGLRVLVITGRSGCPVSVLLDGTLVKGTAQDFAFSEVPQSIIPSGTRDNNQLSIDAKVSIDDVVDGRSVMAMEIYPSAGNAPPELVRAAGRGSCGIIALWTGARR